MRGMAPWLKVYVKSAISLALGFFAGLILAGIYNRIMYSANPLVLHFDVALVFLITFIIMWLGGTVITFRRIYCNAAK